MNTYKIVIEYDGKDFLGWQIQKNTKNTIQEGIESALKQILNQNIRLIASGRTDTNVNALNQVAHFKTESVLNCNRFLYSLNSILPDKIAVKEINKVSDEFHARYSAKKREYEYRITFKKKSICGNYYYKMNYDLDFIKIDKFISILKGDKSFKSLCKNSSDKHNFRCYIFDLNYKLIKSRNELTFSVTANRFLHSMVRAVIGCIIDIGRGRLDFEETKQKFLKGEKIKTTYLPGNALFLKKIYYE